MRTFTKTVSEKQLAANRANAQKSTGPKTQAGREISSQNRRNHGLCGSFKVLACEDQENFERLFDEFVASEQPANAVELELVRKMAEYTWLRNRSSYFHESCFRVEEQSAEVAGIVKAGIRVNPELGKFIRYQAHYDRCYARASAELLRRRKERQLQESRFESQKRAQAAETRREKHEHRQEERHFWHTANAKLDFERKERALTTAAAAQNSPLAA